MEVSTYILLGIFLRVWTKGGVYAAESEAGPVGEACGGGGDDEVPGACGLPPPAAEFPNQELSEEAKRLRPSVQKLTAEVHAAVTGPLFAERLESDATLRLKVTRFLKLLGDYFYLLYGHHMHDASFTSFLSNAQRGTLGAYLDYPEARQALVIFLEVAAGDMGKDLFIFSDSQRNYGKRSYASTLVLLRRVVAQEGLEDFLKTAAHRFLFFRFFLTYLRKMAGNMEERLPFDVVVTDMLRFGSLVDALKDPQLCHELVKKLRVGNSVLTAPLRSSPPDRPARFQASPPSGLAGAAKVKAPSPPRFSAPVEPSAPPELQFPAEYFGPAEPSLPEEYKPPEPFAPGTHPATDEPFARRGPSRVPQPHAIPKGHPLPAIETPAHRVEPSAPPDPSIFSQGAYGPLPHPVPQLYYPGAPVQPAMPPDVATGHIVPLSYWRSPPPGQPRSRPPVSSGHSKTSAPAGAQLSTVPKSSSAPQAPSVRPKSSAPPEQRSTSPVPPGQPTTPAASSPSGGRESPAEPAVPPPSPASRLARGLARLGLGARPKTSFRKKS